MLGAGGVLGAGCVVRGNGDLMSNEGQSFTLGK